jgi:hypothetical protein
MGEFDGARRNMVTGSAAFLAEMSAPRVLTAGPTSTGVQL